MHTTFNDYLDAVLKWNKKSPKEKERFYERSLKKYNPILDDFKASLVARGGNTPVNGCSLIFTRKRVHFMLADEARVRKGLTSIGVLICPDDGGVILREHVYRALENDREPWAFLVATLEDIDRFGIGFFELTDRPYFKRAVDSAIVEIVNGILKSADLGRWR